MECPNCKLINPTDSQHCDCGYDFLTKEIISKSDAEITKKQSNDNSKIAALFLAFGLPLHILPYCLGGLLELQFIGIILICVGGGYLADSRGRSKFWGLLGFFSLFGIIILLLIPKKVK